MKRYFILLILFCAFGGNLSAQVSAREMVELRLPPLDTLFKGAMNSSMVQFYNLRMEGQELALKTEKKKWLEYFSLFGSYQYGIMGVNSYTNLGTDYPLIYQNSGASQIWYNAGASIAIPLDRIFDRGNRIRMQQLKIQETLKEREMWYDDQRQKITELYYRAQEMLNTLKYVIEQCSMADAHLETAQRDYIMGKLNAQELNSAKGTQVQSYIQMEKVLSELNKSLRSLEIVSKIKILNK